MDNEKRLVEIEIKISYQEDMIAELNGVVCRQQKQIDELEALCRKLTSRLEGMGESDGIEAPADEKPPHY